MTSAAAEDADLGRHQQLLDGSHRGPTWLAWMRGRLVEHGVRGQASSSLLSSGERVRQRWGLFSELAQTCQLRCPSPCLHGTA